MLSHAEMWGSILIVYSLRFNEFSDGLNMIRWTDYLYIPDSESKLPDSYTDNKSLPQIAILIRASTIIFIKIMNFY